MACATLKRSHDFDPLGSPSQLQRTPKRRRCSPAASPIKTESCKSPFSDRTPKLSRDELSANVYDEWKRIQRRQRMTGEVSPQSNDRPLPRGVLSPQQLQLNMMPLTTTFSGSFSGNSNNDVSPRTCKDQPMFTAKQVIMLCERLWKEREEKLKEEYDQVLHERLSEQYNAFLKFTQDQIMRKYREPACSYVS